MNNFDKIIKNAVEGYEAPFNASAWENLSQQLSPLEDAVRDAVQDHEAPYDPKAWSKIKNKIGNNANLLRWTIGSAAAVLLIALTILFFPKTENELEVPTLITADKTNNFSNDNQINKITDYSTTNNVETKNLDVTTEHTLASEETTHPNQPHEVNYTESIQNPNNADLGNNSYEQNLPLSNDSLNTNSVDEAEHAQLVDEGMNSETEIQHHNTLPSINYNANFNTTIASACVGSEIYFKPTEIFQNVNYNWFFGDEKTSTAVSPMHQFSEAGTFDIRLKITDKNGKILAQEQKEINISDNPTATIEWSQINEGIPSVIFSSNELNSTVISDFVWKINGTPVSDKLQMEYTFHSKGDYIIALETKNENGCSGISEKNIHIENNFNLFAPASFTPNGDGMNDYFIPRALEIMNTEFVMTIHDQSGRKIYETVDVNEPWNGFNSNSNTIEKSGAFIWTVRLRNSNGTYETFKGQVFIL